MTAAVYHVSLSDYLSSGSLTGSSILLMTDGSSHRMFRTLFFFFTLRKDAIYLSLHINDFIAFLSTGLDSISRLSFLIRHQFHVCNWQLLSSSSELSLRQTILIPKILKFDPVAPLRRPLPPSFLPLCQY